MLPCAGKGSSTLRRRTWGLKRPDEGFPPREGDGFWIKVCSKGHRVEGYGPGKPEGCPICTREQRARYVAAHPNCQAEWKAARDARAAAAEAAEATRRAEAVTKRYAELAARAKLNA